MSRDLRAFVTDFVVPLLAGDDVWIGRPLRPRDRDEWAVALSGTSMPEVAFWRLRRAQLLTAHPSLPDPDIDELSLWIGLHNLLVFEHPDRARPCSTQLTATAVLSAIFALQILRTKAPDPEFQYADSTRSDECLHRSVTKCPERSRRNCGLGQNDPVFAA